MKFCVKSVGELKAGNFLKDDNLGRCNVRVRGSPIPFSMDVEISPILGNYMAG
jgi:hypothetical protein